MSKVVETIDRFGNTMFSTSCHVMMRGSGVCCRGSGGVGYLSEEMDGFWLLDFGLSSSKWLYRCTNNLNTERGNVTSHLTSIFRFWETTLSEMSLEMLETSMDMVVF